ncbi:formyl transferase [Seonamhaeicola sediminis]|uniref:phosphoribosylglycinamide formyltransferase 1 n=1 Tax=Seonamhaeicola sediminis TaxID=2528206 RepID=A0A562YHE7_9FLAO|nr:formyl transferase [Seonamhaeicola sediminis]TWO33978.1 formyl transferase [Seonamhaeicola sediminis]
MKIIMLIQDGESSRIMYNALKEEFKILRVIIEKPVPKISLIKRRIRRLGVLKVVDQLLFQVIVVKVLRILSKRRRKAIKVQNNLKDSISNSNIFTEVESVNNISTIQLIKDLNPDVIIVNGTRIISKKVLSCTNAVFLNTHVGITPKYRGVHGGYWALVSNDKFNCGVTVHKIDEGIDTGDIYGQDSIDVTINDNFTTYPLLQLVKGIVLMKNAIKSLENKTFNTYKNNEISKLWYHPTISQYLYYRVFKGIK